MYLFTCEIQSALPYSGDTFKRVCISPRNGGTIMSSAFFLKSNYMKYYGTRYGELNCNEVSGPQRAFHCNYPAQQSIVVRTSADTEW